MFCPIIKWSFHVIPIRIIAGVFISIAALYKQTIKSKPEIQVALRQKHVGHFALII